MSANKPSKRRPTGDYPVGYAKPPKASQFQPGQSGNSNGRPKGRPSFDEILLEEAARIVKVKVGNDIVQMDKGRALARKLFDMGLQGQLAALRFAAERLAQAENAQDATADPEAPLTEDELAVLALLPKKPRA
jgi:hypothetical protein